MIQRQVYSLRWLLIGIFWSTLATVLFSLVYGGFAIAGLITGAWTYIALAMLLLASATSCFLIFRAIVIRGFHLAESNQKT